jgi:ferrous-iron efflux pump FieF
MAGTRRRSIPDNPPLSQPDGLDRADRSRLMIWATIASVSIALILIAAKLVAWLLTGSVAVLSTLVDSLLDAGASIVTMFAVRTAVQPADQEHRFGHGKAEALAGLAQAAFIAGSGFFVIIESVKRLFEPTDIRQEWVGIGVMGLSILLTLILVGFQHYVIRRTKSVAISADALHYKGDLLINLSVVISLLGHLFWSVPYLDPIFALGIVGYLFWNAWKIMRESFDILMDRELPEADREKIKEIAMSHSAARSLHDLRSRRSGTDVFIQFHLELDPEMRLLEAHEIADEVEALVIQAFPGAEVIIHQDPEGLEEDHPNFAHG